MNRSASTGAAVLRRSLAASACAASALLGACSDNTAPNPVDQIPDLFYVSNQAGADEIYTWKKGVSAAWSATIAGDVDPQSANGKVVFTSFRDDINHGSIYIANNDGSGVKRLTTATTQDREPSLKSDGSIVVFTRQFNDLPQLFTVASDGTNPTQFNTGGDPDFDDSFRPRYSPDGSQILFLSTRSGSAQVYTVPSGGGSATQVTHEPNGAFDASWSQDGASIFYIDGLDRTRLHRISVASGTVVDYITGGTDLGQPACTGSLCVVVSGASTPNGDILAYIGQDATSPTTVVNTGANEREPAFIR